GVGARGVLARTCAPARHDARTGRCRARRRRGRARDAACLSGPSPLVPPFAELLDGLVAEGGQIVRLPARDETVVDDDLRVDPLRTGVDEIGLDARPRRDG